MKIKFWGARGSVPVSGADFLNYGGDTTCVEIRNSAGEILIIDAGTGIRHLGKALVKEKKRDLNLIFTHSHLDHIIGFPFFVPIYFWDFNVKMRNCSFNGESVKDVISEIMKPPRFPVKFSEISATFSFADACSAERDYFFAGLNIRAVEISHPNSGYGYRFRENGKSFVFLTDNELGSAHEKSRGFNEYAEFCRGTDLLVHDAEYRSEEYPRRIGWGHSPMEDAVKLALRAEAKKLGLFHHNQDRTDSEIDEMVAECRRLALGSGMEIFAVRQGQEINLA